MSARNDKPSLSPDDARSLHRKLVLKKCFRSWRKVTFGRVSPAKARKHYRKRLLSTCLHTWKDTHLPSRIEWKLMIRAEYHERFRLWQKCLNSWKEYVVMMKDEKILMEKASKFHHTRLYRMCFTAFQLYKEQGKVKKSHLEQARLFREKRLQQQSWQRWIYVFNNSHVLKNMDFIALKHWAQSIVGNAFIKWQNVYLDQCDYKKRLMYAEIYYSTRLVHRTLSAWGRYLEERRKKKEKKAMAEEKYNRCLVSGLFRKWKHAFQLQLLVKESEKAIVLHGERFVKRRYFNHFRAYYEFKCHMRSLMEEAAVIHNKKLKKIYFHKLKLAVELQKVRRQQKEEAIAFHSNQLLFRYFMQWTTRCDHADDIKLIPLTRIAYRYHRLKLITHVLLSWKLFVKEKRRKEMLKQIAEHHHNTKILPRCFAAWRDFVDIEHEKAEMVQLSARFSEELLYSKYFYTWLKELKLREADAVHEDTALHHCNEIRIKKSFLYWKSRAEDCSAKRLMEEKASKFELRWILVKYLSRWKQKLNDNNLDLIGSSKADHFYRRKLMQKTWRGFQIFHLKKKSKEMKMLRADSFYFKNIGSLVFRSWSMYVDQRRQIHSKITQKCEERNEIIKRWVLATWKVFVQEEKQERKRLLIAEKHLVFLLKRRSFIALKEYAATRIRKRYYEDERVIRASIKLEQSYLAAVFKKWRESAREHCELKEKNVASKIHYETVALRKTFLAWKQHVCMCVRVRIFYSRAKLFHDMNMERRYLLVWRKRLEDAQEEARKSNMAILWWSYQLQRKVISAMQEFRVQQKRKRDEYASALTFRKNAMMEDGVVSWLKFASHAMDRRRDIAYREQARRTTELQGRVHRYALKWLRKTREGRKVPNAKRDLDLHPSNVVLKNIQPAITSPTIRCKKFSAQFPITKARLPPRLPDYLRGSFDLSSLQCKENQSPLVPGVTLGSQSTRSNDIIPIHECLDNSGVQANCSDVSNNTGDIVIGNVHEAEAFPRVLSNSKIMHSPVIHPMSLSCAESVRLLELTDDTHPNNSSSKLSIGINDSDRVLLPPSSFTKLGSLPV